MENLPIQLAPAAAFAAALGYLVLLALSIRIRGLPGLVERWFAGYLVLSAAWTVAWTFAHQLRWVKPQVNEIGASIAIYIAALLPAALVVLTLHFLPRRGARELVFVGLAWTAAVVVVERGLLGESQSESILGPLRLVGWAAFIVGSVVLTTLEYFRLRRPLHRNRVLYWLLALTLVALGEGLHYLNNIDVAQMGMPLRLVGAGLMTYAIATYSLPDLKSIGRRTLLVVIVSLVRAAFFLGAMGVGVLAYQVIEPSPLFTVGGGIAIALLLAVLQVPLQRFFFGATERLLFGPGYDASRALRDYSQSISNILLIERLAEVAIETIAGALDIERGALLLIAERYEGGADVRVIPGMGDIAAMNVVFEPGSPVLHALRDTNRPLTQYDVDMLPEFRNMDAQERQWQWALDVEVYVPIHAKRTLIGALVLGAKQTGEPYSAQDLDVLNTLAGQTAVALENASLFDDQRRLNEEISQLNLELTDANTRLQKLDKAKSDFLNITSHELRTPLTQVRGYADILGEIMEQDEVNKPFMRKVSGNIRKATDRLEAIYSAMIDVSAIGVDALQLHFDAVLPMIFVFQAVEKWREAVQERGQTLEMNGIEELPHIEGDSERLVQAFSNLLNNAIKFTPDGGKIEIWGRVVHGGPEEVIEIIISDTGIGIDPADHEMIFEKFYRVGNADLHSTGTTKFKGAGPGLGLPIAKGVIEGHKGRIWVESPGHSEETYPGSRFHVLLPIKSSVPDPESVTEQLKKSRPVTGLSRRLAEKSE
jgi:signal transduction histidine kinase